MPVAIAPSRSGDTLQCHRSQVGNEHTWKNLCTANFVGAHVKAELDKLDNKAEVSLELYELPTQEDFDTIVELPWLRELSVGSQAREELPDLRSLDALAKLPDLESVSIYGASHIDDIGVLASLKKLRIIRLDNLRARSLEPLRGLAALEGVYLYSAAVSDLAPLVGKNLRSLHISRSDVRNLAALAQIPGLVHLGMRGVDAEDISVLRSLTLLDDLDIADNRIKDLAPLSSLTRLSRLVASKNAITKLDPISRLPRLGLIDISGNPLADLSPLASMPITWLEMEGCKNVRSLAPLAGYKLLNKLAIGGTSITSLDPLLKVKINNGLVVPKTVPAANVDRFRKARPDVEIKLEP
jgi:Leucine-rich repeat (LRR) protein